MCCHRGNAAQPVTTMRLVRYRTLDLSRLAETEQIVRELEAGRLDRPRGVRPGLRCDPQPAPVPPLVATFGWAGLAASIALCSVAGRSLLRPRSSRPRASTGSAGCCPGGASPRSSSRHSAGSS
ncbi:threonine/serine exporter family protein [Pseudonocardia sp. MCCB 268]|nr:threonine/serine exporter family protein [Pseudonocardia cytotoxica]